MAAKETLEDYLYRECSEVFASWEPELRDEVYALAFKIANWGGGDDKGRRVTMNSIQLGGMTETQARDIPSDQFKAGLVKWIPFWFSGGEILQVPGFENGKSLDAYELALYDEWLALHGVVPEGKDEGGRNVYPGGITSGTTSFLNNALSLACQGTVRRLHAHGFCTINGKTFPIFICHDSGCEGIISIPATVRCNPPEALTDFLAYANLLRGTQLEWEWTVDFREE